MAGDDCLFCAIVAGDAPAHIVLDEPDVVAFLDIRPVFKGHVLVVPREHVVTLPELADAAADRAVRRGAALRDARSSTAWARRVRGSRRTTS